MKRVFATVTALLTVVCLTGCSVLLKGEGELGFKQSTEWALYHRAANSENECSSAFECQSLEDYIKTKTEAPECPGGTCTKGECNVCCTVGYRPNCADCTCDPIELGGDPP